MKKIFPISLCFLLLLFSCEKIIDVDLNEASPAIVIEGNLTKYSSLSSVKITKTGSYFSETKTENVTGAQVYIENDRGRHFDFIETSDGVYKSFGITAKEGRTYTLTVQAEGKIYQASSKLNKAVPIESITYKYDEGFSIIDAGYYLTLHFSDPAQIENYYRVKIYKDGEYKNSLNNFVVFDDRLFDGSTVEKYLSQRVFQIGEEAKVELISLDKGAYEFYDTFREVLGTNPGTAAPSNPISNFSNGALGYFSVWSLDSKTINIEK